MMSFIINYVINNYYKMYELFKTVTIALCYYNKLSYILFLTELNYKLICKI